MAKGFKHGTSGKKENPLNFTVEAYPSEVEMNTATPKDTSIITIGVVTTNPITGWYFTAEQPENMAEGEVWFPTVTTSSGKFNALKKNNINVYPMSAKQQVSGTLADVKAKSYQDGEWVDWTKRLYFEGNEYTEITGGWTSAHADDGTYTKGEFGKYGTHMRASVAVSQNIVVRTVRAISLKDVKTIKIRLNTNVDSNYPLFFFVNSTFSDLAGAAEKTTISKRITYTGGQTWINVDVSALTGNYFIGFQMWIYGTGPHWADIYEVQYE